MAESQTPTDETETECIHCGATDEPEADIHVRVEQAETGSHYQVCNICEPPVDDIETGIESDHNIPNEAVDVDVRAFADDGEFATLFDVTRVDETTVEVAYRRCEAGRQEFDMDEQFEIRADKTTERWAIECANADPEMSVELARQYWN